MIPFLAAVFFAPSEIVLQRGNQLPTVQTEYWDVQEAEIDSAAPNLPIPTMFALTGDKGRNILMRFGSLDLATGNGLKIVGGTVELTLVDAEKAFLKSVRVLNRGWATPGINVFAKRLKPKPDATTTPIFSPGVTWSHAGGDVSKWQAGGALGANDSSSVAEKFTVNGDKVSFDLPAETLENWRLHEGSNHGLLLEFSAQTAIWSSISPETRPKLTLRVAPSETRIGDAGLSSDGKSFSVAAKDPVKEIEVWNSFQMVYSGEPKPIEIRKPRSQDPRNRLYKVIVRFQNPQLTDQVLTFDPEGKEYQMRAIEARIWNQWSVDQSAYSFAPFGALKYVNARIADGEPFSKGKLFPVQPWGDRRSDAQLLSALVPPVRSTNDPLFNQLARPIAGPLSLSEVSYLASGKIEFPTVLIAKLITPDGVDLEKTKFKIDGVEYTSDAQGLSILTKFPSGTVKNLSISAERHETSDSFECPSFRFSDLHARGNTQGISIQIPFHLPLLPINRESNLVFRKPTSDAAKSFPAQLIGLTDDDPQTKYRLAPGAWVQIDLGRDRLLGEITAHMATNETFLVKVFQTGENAENAMSWLNTSLYTEYVDAKKPSTTYYPTPTTARFIRIYNPGKTEIIFNDLAVFAAKRS